VLFWVLTSLGFTVTHIDGTVVSPVEGKAEVKQESMFCFTLQQSLLLLCPYQTQTAKVCLSDNVAANTMQTGVLSPTDDLIVERLCGLPDELWVGQKAVSVPLTNWTQEPVILEKGTVVGRLEEASLIDGQDSL